MIRIATQKSGRLADKSIELMKACGLDFNWSKNNLLSQTTNFPLEIMLVRDDDIPAYVRRGICDLGFVGENVWRETASESEPNPILERRLGFGRCRLSVAVPLHMNYRGPGDLQGLRIATSYPRSLQKFLQSNKINAEIAEISGSVELAPVLGVADAICDLVSTGTTLKSNNLKESQVLFESECLLVRTPCELSDDKKKLVNRFMDRIDGVQRADKNKYIMMNAPREALKKIHEIIPGMDNPSIMQLDGDENKVAIHAVCQENVFWETMEKLKEVGATSILVVPIEKIL